MSDDTDPDLEEYGRRRLIQLCEWREILIHGTDGERQALVASLREIDIRPLFSTLDADEAEVRATASEHRTALALGELRRKTEAAVSDGDFDTAAQWLDLRLSVEDAHYRDNAGRLESP